MNNKQGVEILDLKLSAESFAQIPDWNSRIWRYMDLAKFVSLLQNGALYFPVVAELGDDLEGTPPRVPSGNALQELSAFSAWSVNRCITFASCWHLGEDESAAMWAIYAGRQQGIAIQSTLDALKKAFPPAAREDLRETLKIGLVEYIDPDLEVTPPHITNLYADVLRKRHWYAYEKEVRVICSPPDNWVGPVSVNEQGRFRRSGVLVRCNLRELIQQVVVAPHAPPYFRPDRKSVV